MGKNKRIYLGIVIFFITIIFGVKCLLTTEITFSDEMSYIATALRFLMEMQCLLMIGHQRS